MVFTFISCSKGSTSNNNSNGDSTYVISEDSSFQIGNPGNNQVRVFTYNNNNLIKVQYKQGGSASFTNYDTIYFANGYPSKVVSYNVGNPVAYDSSLYFYSGGLVDSMREIGTNNNGAYIATTIFVYNSSKLDSMSVHYYVGSPSGGGGGPTALSSIVYSGNNFASAIAYTPSPVAVTITADLTASNPYYGLVFSGNVGSILSFFDKNNALKVFETSTPTNVLYNDSYTYSNGRVATYTDSTSSPYTTTNITYTKL
jgi:hypothetical protein